jgi:hypothetical protein
MTELGNSFFIGVLLLGLVYLLYRVEQLEKWKAEMEKKREPGEE